MNASASPFGTGTVLIDLTGDNSQAMHTPGATP